MSRWLCRLLDVRLQPPPGQPTPPGPAANAGGPWQGGHGSHAPQSLSEQVLHMPNQQRQQQQQQQQQQFLQNPGMPYGLSYSRHMQQVRRLSSRSLNPQICSCFCQMGTIDEMNCQSPVLQQLCCKSIIWEHSGPSVIAHPSWAVRKSCSTLSEFELNTTAGRRQLTLDTASDLKLQLGFRLYSPAGL